MDDTRTVIIDGSAGWHFETTVIASAFDDAAMRQAIVLPAREWEIGFPGWHGLKRRQIVTITIPHWEFQTKACVTSVKGNIVRLREQRS